MAEFRAIPPDALVARIAARQHGVVTTAQLYEAGVDKDAIGWRVVSGRLHRLHRGVYAVGHRGLSREGVWNAAVLAYGDRAVLSHRSAAELWALLKPAAGPVHVTVPTRSGLARRSGVHLHRRQSLPHAATTCRDGIAVTTPARTVADLRRTVSAALVRRAIRQAELLGYPLEFSTDRTRSDLEAAFLEICRRRRVSMPEVNAPISRFTVDFLWRAQRLIVEVDSYRYHGGRQAFRDDRDRDIELGELGFTVLRIADSRIDDDPAGVGALLARRVG